VNVTKADDLTLGGIPYGTVYLIDPELSPQERRADLETIQGDLGFNTVVLWPAMSRWDGDPPGEVAFDSVDRVMDDCAELGLKAILELQGQNCSYHEAPERAELPPGTPRESSRDIPINDPLYKQQTRRTFHAVAEHFKGHPALLAYDLFNEVGNLSRDEATIAEFVAFLREQYADDVSAMNAAWGTFFADFEGVLRVPPRFTAWLWSSCVAERDWQRFRTHNFADRLAEWASWIREVDRDVIVLADILGVDSMHSRSSGYYGITDRQVAERMDVLGLSCYGNMLGRQWWKRDAWRWAQWWRSATSAAGGKQTIISEMMTQNRTLFPWEGSSMTDQIRLWSYQAMFHGIGGLIYWKFRPFRKGMQVAGRGLTDFAARPNRFGRDAAEVAAFVNRNADRLAGVQPDAAGCAILHDPNTQDIYQSIQSRWPDFYTDAVGGMFRGFWRHGVSPAFVQPRDLDADGGPAWLRVLAVPCNASVSQTTADALAAFVRRGGVLLTESRFALLDEDGRLWPHVPGGGLADVLGLEERNFTARMCGAVATGDSEPLVLEDDFFQELALAGDVEVLMATEGGAAALVARKVGKGRIVHAAIQLGQLIHEDRPGATAVFDKAFEYLAPALVATVPVKSKPERTDVSALVDESGKPSLVGITNYETVTATVRLGWSAEPAAVEGDAAATAVVNGDTLTVTVPARSVAAVWL
jgi:beta-galactosidase